MLEFRQAREDRGVSPTLANEGTSLEYAQFKADSQEENISPRMACTNGLKEATSALGRLENQLSTDPTHPLLRQMDLSTAERFVSSIKDALVWRAGIIESLYEGKVEKANTIRGVGTHRAHFAEEVLRGTLTDNDLHWFCKLSSSSLELLGEVTKVKTTSDPSAVELQVAAGTFLHAARGIVEAVNALVPVTTKVTTPPLDPVDPDHKVMEPGNDFGQEAALGETSVILENESGDGLHSSTNLQSVSTPEEVTGPDTAVVIPESQFASTPTAKDLILTPYAIYRQMSAEKGTEPVSQRDFLSVRVAALEEIADPGELSTVITSLDLHKDRWDGVAVLQAALQRFSEKAGDDALSSLLGQSNLLDYWVGRYLTPRRLQQLLLEGDPPKGIASGISAYTIKTEGRAEAGLKVDELPKLAVEAKSVVVRYFALQAIHEPEIKIKIMAQLTTEANRARRIEMGPWRELAQDLSFTEMMVAGLKSPSNAVKVFPRLILSRIFSFGWESSPIYSK